MIGTSIKNNVIIDNISVKRKSHVNICVVNAKNIVYVQVLNIG